MGNTPNPERTKTSSTDPKSPNDPRSGEKQRNVIEVPGRPDRDRDDDRKPAYGPGGGSPVAGDGNDSDTGEARDTDMAEEETNGTDARGDSVPRRDDNPSRAY